MGNWLSLELGKVKEVRKRSVAPSQLKGYWYNFAL